MGTETLQTTVIKLNSVLEIERKIIGVKFLFEKEDFDNADAKPLINKSPYCVMVKSAMIGVSIKANLEQFGCNGAINALGMAPPDELSRSGRSSLKLGLYQDIVVAKSARNDITFCNHLAYGVMLKPLEKFTEAPDIVIIVTNSYNAMRIIQGYCYIYGTQKNFKIGGNQAICSECTAYPFESNDINVSVLCSGTRFWCAWSKNDFAIGIPYNKFADIVEGVLHTVNATEPLSEKLRIGKNLKDNNITDIYVDYDKSYYYNYAKK
ncbi:protein of unknown function DUF169 [Gottschalkia purinilytica]|uniref:ArCR n=1 Tax=Gottschalkia purinilytica TaxID=1503 RepID=A0A0L0WC73_GOTPU|nr:DUF169 domain-containing protein [Gottschalkia purinilytica]KNF09067.1 protein of unknown function DUF169 [Gottschalkia purinilytica]